MKEFLPRPRSLRPPLGFIDLTSYLKKGGDPSLPSNYPEEERENIFYPDPVVIPLLVQALDQLDAGISLRAATDWFNDRLDEAGESSARRVSHAGLKKIWDRERPDHPKRETHVRTPSFKTRIPREKRVELKKKKKIASEKIRITHAKKRIEKFQQELDEYKESKKEKPFIEVSATEYDFEVIPEAEDEHIFVPNPGPQTQFLAASEDEVLYGGAAGGGKSYALLADAMRYFDNPHFKGLLIRRTNDELRELVSNSRFLYKRAYPKANFSQQKSTWTFPSGATLWMTYLDDEKDMSRFQGQSFTWIGFDELTHHPTPHAWNYLRTRLRSADPETAQQLCMRATTNPGGPGHGWVKAMFIDPAPPNTSFFGTDIESGEILRYPKNHEKKPNQPLLTRKFIPAKVSDNPYLWNDGVYEANLMMQPEHTRRQLLEGDWTVAEGAAFPEFRLSVHTCEPFDLPSYWTRFRSCDFGYSERQASAVHWYAIDPNTSVLYVYRELYINQLTGSELAHRILEMERGEYISYGVLDSSCWSVRGQTGPSIAEEMIRAGCKWKPSDRSQGSRIASKNRLHELLRVDPVNGLPGIIFFNNCRRIIGDLPVIPSDKDSDDIDPKYAYDHAYDSIRYGIQTRPQTRSSWNRSASYRPANSTFGY